MKKIYFTLGILLLGTIAMAYFYFSNLNTERNANDLSLNAVVKDAGIVFSFDNDKSFYEILSGQTMLQQVLGDTKSKQLKNIWKYLLTEPSISNETEGQKTYIGFSGAPEQINFIIGTQFKKAISIELLVRKFRQKNIKISADSGVYKITFPDSSNIFIGAKERLVILSNDSKSVAMAFGKTTANTAFSAYIKANTRPNKNTLANLYVNYNAIPALLKEVISNKISGELNILNNQDSFAALSYSYSKEKLLFNGTTSVNSSTNYLKLFTNIPAQKITIDRILPDQTANYTIYAIDNYPSWQKELNNWLSSKKETQKVEEYKEKINQQYRIDLQQIFPKYFKDQLMTFQLNTGEKFGAIALTNGDKTNQQLLELSTEYAPGVRIFKEPFLLYIFFGEPFKKFDRPFYCIIDNYLIMANNASSIQSFLNSYNNNSLLINKAHYLRFNEQLSSSATIAFYINHQNSYNLFGRNLRMPYYKHHLDKDGLRTFSAFSYQLISDKGKFLSNLLLYKDPEKNNATDTIPSIP